jgi:hypothetical protein
MKLFLSLILVILNASSCYKGEEITTLTTGIGNFQINPDQAFTSSQIRIIKNICNNLKDKREVFNGYKDLEKHFKFHVEILACNGITIFKNDIDTVLSNTNSTDLEYFADFRNDYLKNVITDQTPGIKLLCDNVDAPNLKNVFYDSHISYSFDVLIKSGFNRLIMIKSLQDNSGKFIPKVGDGIDFFTYARPGETTILGMENERMHSQFCTDGKLIITTQALIR